MRRSVGRAVVVWLVVTLAVVAGTGRAVDVVTRDVTVRRPAPMTPNEVGRRLRERRGSESTTVPSTREREPVAPSSRPPTAGSGTTAGPNGPTPVAPRPPEGTPGSDDRSGNDTSRRPVTTAPSGTATTVPKGPAVTPNAGGADPGTTGRPSTTTTRTSGGGEDGQVTPGGAAADSAPGGQR